MTWSVSVALEWLQQQIKLTFSLVTLMLNEDLANQIKFSRMYQAQAANTRSRFLSLPCAEWFSGAMAMPVECLC